MPLELLIIIGFVLFTIIGVLVFLLINKSDQILAVKAQVEKLRRSFDELDEQAKLIVKTDLELNKAQEELDKRLKGLDALQKTSRLISTTLDENEIFHRLNQSLMAHLDFEKYVLLLYDGTQQLTARFMHHFTDEDIKFILAALQKNQPLTQSLKEGRTFSSVKSSETIKDTLGRLFNVAHFVMAPILTQNGILGILFVGNASLTSPITEGDEELISILANQIGQATENARLFEQAYSSTQSLENKVQDRTKQLASALEEVQLINKTKSEFISAVSHELRTPLTSIKGYASLLMTGKLGEIPEQVKTRLEKINIHSDNLVKLINELLDIARIESGRVEMKIAAYHVGSLIDSVHDLLTPQMRDKNLQWATNLDPALPPVMVDRSHVERVFINLVGNAIKFTPQGGTISIKAYPEGDRVKVEISDTGIGIKEEDCAKLFNEFYRVDNEVNQNVKGTGLGLTLVKKVVEAHHGKVWVTSQLNKGTTFHFTLPTRQDDTAHAIE
jgi:signal transduction histidine kinase